MLNERNNFKVNCKSSAPNVFTVHLLSTFGFCNSLFLGLAQLTYTHLPFLMLLSLCWLALFMFSIWRNLCATSTGPGHAKHPNHTKASKCNSAFAGSRRVTVFGNRTNCAMQIGCTTKSRTRISITATGTTIYLQTNQNCEWRTQSQTSCDGAIVRYGACAEWWTRKSLEKLLPSEPPNCYSTFWIISHVWRYGAFLFVFHTNTERIPNAHIHD